MHMQNSIEKKTICNFPVVSSAFTLVTPVSSFSEILTHLKEDQWTTYNRVEN